MEKKIRTSKKTALLNLSFSRAVRLSFAMMTTVHQLDTFSIILVSFGKVTGQKPVFSGVSRFPGIIPTRSCQKFSKQICLWDLAQSVCIVFIIQIVWAI